MQRTVPPRARQRLTFAPILCGANSGCCAAVSTAGSNRERFSNARIWHDLTRLARTTVFVRESDSSFCAKITTGDADVIALPYLLRKSLRPEELMQSMQSLADKLGFNRAAEYFSYEPRVGNSMPGQTLMPCGIPDSVCSCSGETEVHVWDDDPQLPQTLAHEAVHAWLYHTQRPFSHCSGLAPPAGCQTVDRLTLQAEHDAQLNSRRAK